MSASNPTRLVLYARSTSSCLPFASETKMRSDCVQAEPARSPIMAASMGRSPIASTSMFRPTGEVGLMLEVKAIRPFRGNGMKQVYELTADLFEIEPPDTPTMQTPAPQSIAACSAMWIGSFGRFRGARREFGEGEEAVVLGHNCAPGSGSLANCARSTCTGVSSALSQENDAPPEQGCCRPCTRAYRAAERKG